MCRYTRVYLHIFLVYKANISCTHFFSDRLKMNVSGYMTLGRNNYMYVDRNMVDDSYFRLVAEGNRGVYVPLLIAEQ